VSDERIEKMNEEKYLVKTANPLLKNSAKGNVVCLCSYVAPKKISGNERVRRKKREKVEINERKQRTQVTNASNEREWGDAIVTLQ
jgi:hypothetical protein